MGRRIWLRVILTVVVAAGAAGVGYVGWHAFNRKDEVAPVVRCLRNVETLGRALEAYRADNGGAYPPSLVALLEGGYLSANLAPVLCCPADETPAVVDTPAGAVCMSYHYAPPPETSGDCPVIWEGLSNHGDGGNVYFRSGRAMWVPRRYYPVREVTDEALRPVHPGQ